MLIRTTRWLMAFVAALAAAGAEAAEAPADGIHKPAGGQKVDYVQDVRPIFARRCSRCHGANKQEAGLRLDAGQLVRKGSEDGPVIVPGKPAESKLIARVAATDDSRMPPEGERLEADEVAVLRSWIEMGAHSPADERIPQDPTHHWSFQPPQKPPVPVLRNATADNPIDAFIAARLISRSCEPVGMAARAVLLRRVTLDLTGLPPTVGEVRAFLDDKSPDAYARVVDRLLGSPEYGERWARHWMDVWRYSDWYGFGNELRNSARHIWRWRDWIVESLNADKPYNEMIIEMLAADEIAPLDADRLRATGFLARNYYVFNRNVWLDNAVEHTAKAFLGITLNCARCHDHMYDPIPQADYYRFRAIFEPYQVRLDRVPGRTNPTADGLSRVYDAELATPTFLYVRGNDKSPDKKHPLSAGVPAALHGPKWNVRPIALPKPAFHPGLLSFVQTDEIAAAEQACTNARQKLSQSQQRLDAATAGADVESTRQQHQLNRIEFASAQAALESLTARIAAEGASFADPPHKNAHDLAAIAARAERHAAVCAAEFAVAQAKLPVKPSIRRGRQQKRAKRTVSADQQLAAAEKNLAEARKQAEHPGDHFTPLSPTYPSTSSGRRQSLARWIASDQNPLTARVAVNHVWLRHFGKPLVPTVFDFGINGKSPTHPELFDWLAVNFMRSGWSLKKLHRLLVLSEAYQRDSVAEADHAQSARIDPDNQLLWRMNPRRLESEAVRDSVLAVSSRLDHVLGGPETDARLGETTYRRSIYYRHAPEKFMTFLQTFDAPSTTECYMRKETVVPQQALALSNSTLAIDQARRLAGQLTRIAGTDPSTDTAYIDALFEHVLCRGPSTVETAACHEFLQRQAALISGKELTKSAVGRPSTVKGSADPRQRAREDLAHVLLNHNEFVTIR